MQSRLVQIAAFFALLAACVPTGRLRPYSPATAPDPPATVSPQPAQLVQLIHRGARDEAGALESRALLDAVDRLVVNWTEEDFPFDGWTRLAGDATSLEIWAPDGGAFAQALFGRAEQALADRQVRMHANASDSADSKNAVWVLAFGDAEDVSTRWPELAARLLESGRSAPAVVFVDLFEPSPGGDSWRADTCLVGDARGVALASWAILTARAEGSFPDVAARAADFGVDPEQFDWWRDALAGQ